ncbi:MAG: hypothetical protein C7N36_19455 [Bacteroidetes bacterium]|nr:MAG: hypothetical protein C7N36_19455 [Bacteroidota bacterium]
MKIYQYECRLLTDVVISSDTASEGFKKSLDYIPGAKFLGIAARKLYQDEDPLKMLDLFHNGTVRFGDAHPKLDDQYSLRVPFAWLLKKGGEVSDGLYLHHKLSDDFRQELQGIQLQQARSGYFLPCGKWLKSIPQEFSIKSAYDRTKRRARDQQMYGYFALPQGTSWLFTVEDEKGDYADSVREVLQGKHRVGRSRSAEYGLAEITFDQEISLDTERKQSQEAVLYAESNLLFYDGYGQPTLQPDETQLCLPIGSIIDWSRSQIRSRLYQTWNRKRYNRDADRMIIEKGSVIVCRLPSDSAVPGAMRVGAQQAEGFGKLLVNPSFLQSSHHLVDLHLSKTEEQQQNWVTNTPLSYVKEGVDDQLVLSFLHAQHEKDTTYFNIEKEVNLFIVNQPDFQGISPSQWGMVRTYAKHAANLESFQDLLFTDGVGCLTRGQSEKDWRKKGRRDKLYKYLFETENIPQEDIIPFTIKLSAEMAKANKK